MQFEKLTHTNLRKLKELGYNILSSNNNLADDTVIWYPERVEDVCEYVFEVADQEPTLLVIQDALDNISEDDLIGNVLI